MPGREIVLVDTGVFQEYILDNIRNLQLFGNTQITVIIDRAFEKHFKKFPNITLIFTEDIPIGDFEDKNRQDRYFRGGFWRNCSKRFFYIYSYMKMFHRTNCIHIENDVMVYCNVNTLPIDETKLWCCCDASSRCIPSIMYIPTAESIGELIQSYNHSINDMDNLVSFYNSHRENCYPFPICSDENIHYGVHFRRYNALFDAAAIGQYLGGVDPRNAAGDTRGFKNETCVIDYSLYSFYWVKQENLHIPHIKINETLIPIVNLHIHSKRLSDFMADSPNEQKLISLQ